MCFLMWCLQLEGAHRLHTVLALHDDRLVVDVLTLQEDHLPVLGAVGAIRVSELVDHLVVDAVATVARVAIALHARLGR